ncbi:hypothetical protein OSB04_028838 [Centaurea solstitialis]|uniref:Reverse transcriptase Ty1/copia-type domain-containing protein n=1 Tax=Centaurea solstitialis TaxID=347529 RepID=A0AA38VY67_9ASTR|nr:hypothetical protein OSB04_028838 [Centaurea solstitialis]
MLSREFAMTDLGKLHHFLGIKATHNSNGLFLDQSQYTKDIISHVSMSSCKPCTTPVDLNAKLNGTDGPLFHDPTLYRSLAGPLLYLTSSVEAEYRCVANVVAEATWVRSLLLELQLPLQQASIVYCDNVSAVYLSDTLVQHQRTKPIEIDIILFRKKFALDTLAFFMCLPLYGYRLMWHRLPLMWPDFNELASD